MSSVNVTTVTAQMPVWAPLGLDGWMAPVSCRLQTRLLPWLSRSCPPWATRSPHTPSHGVYTPYSERRLRVLVSSVLSLLAGYPFPKAGQPPAS